MVLRPMQKRTAEPQNRIITNIEFRSVESLRSTFLCENKFDEVSGYYFVMPAEHFPGPNQGVCIQSTRYYVFWIPAFAGMTASNVIAAPSSKTDIIPSFDIRYSAVRYSIFALFFLSTIQTSQYLLHQFIRIHAFGFTSDVKRHTVPQGGFGDIFDVFQRNIVTAVN